jgi:hypothetical protein
MPTFESSAFGWSYVIVTRVLPLDEGVMRIDITLPLCVQIDSVGPVGATGGASTMAFDGARYPDTLSLVAATEPDELSAPDTCPNSLHIRFSARMSNPAHPDLCSQIFLHSPGSAFGNSAVTNPLSWVSGYSLKLCPLSCAAAEAAETANTTIAYANSMTPVLDGRCLPFHFGSHLISITST